MIILAGAMVPVGLFIPSISSSPILINLPGTWQVPSVLLCALVAGPRAGVIAALAYLTLGLLHIPVFDGGGGLDYAATPGFGYLAGFIPAAWISGKLANQKGMEGLIPQTLSALAGLFCLHIICSRR